MTNTQSPTGAITIISEYFNWVDDLLEAIYQNAGIIIKDYDYVRTGYGGGIDDAQQMLLVGCGGYIRGVRRADKQQGDTLMKAINDALIERYPDEVNAENVPFINLTEDA